MKEEEGRGEDLKKKGKGAGREKKEKGKEKREELCIRVCVCSPPGLEN